MARRWTYAATVKDVTGAPVANANVTVMGRMADGMSVVAPLRASGGPGIYRGDVLFTMAGEWQLRVRVAWQNRRVEIPFVERVDP